MNEGERFSNIFDEWFTLASISAFTIYIFSKKITAITRELQYLHCRDRQGGLGLQCAKCGEGRVTSRDGRMCLECEQGLDPGKWLLGDGLVTSQDGRMCLECEQGLDPGKWLLGDGLVTS
jgi:hypothetical protein